MNTKNRIIEASIQLFNRYGVEQVSIRQIASEIQISHSNLSYHYKSKSDILHQIYSRMDEEMSDAVFPSKDLTLIHYHQLLKKISAFQKKYQFFYMDLLAVARAFPEIIKRYRITVKKRSEDYRSLIQHFIEKKLIKPEEENGFYTSLFHAIWVMSTFWLQQEKVLGASHPLIKSGSDIKHVWEIMLPHLTPKGLKEYQSFIDSDTPKARPIQNKYLKQLNS